MGALSKLFGFSKSGTQEYGPETVIPSLTNVAGGEDLLTTFRDRLAGRGVGYGDLTRLVKPYEAQRMAQLNELEMPTISNQASARGLGKSTIPVNRSAFSAQAAGRDVASKTAELDLMNQQQKRLEINNALAGLQRFNEAEGSQQARAAQLATGIRQSQLAGEERADQAQQAGLGRTIGLGAMALGGLGGGLLGAGVEGIGGLKGALAGMQLGGSILSDPVSGATAAGKTLGYGQSSGLFNGANIIYPNDTEDNEDDNYITINGKKYSIT